MGDPTPADDDRSAESGTTVPADVKDRFRQALERKRGGGQPGSGGDATGERTKATGAHGAGHQQRHFRRRAGG